MRRKILAKFLNRPVNKIFKGDFGCNSFDDLTANYIVLTEEEANEEAKRHVWNFIHTFDTDFLIKHLGKQFTEERVFELLSRRCDNCLWVMAELMPDYDSFAQEAVTKYGRAYFICFSDKTEYKMEYNGQYYFIYCMV
ncbi:hypothetical protein [Bacteroides thetaiotaomicron]|uniref:hypothetical protein n=1 Tax=Bacteroides thetaiotaomicron TaxID=818 RepID=UPI0032190B76